jgi:hypothetical protein
LRSALSLTAIRCHLNWALTGPVNNVQTNDSLKVTQPERQHPRRSRPGLTSERRVDHRLAGYSAQSGATVSSPFIPRTLGIVTSFPLADNALPEDAENLILGLDERTTP